MRNKNVDRKSAFRSLCMSEISPFRMTTQAGTHLCLGSRVTGSGVARLESRHKKDTFLVSKTSTQALGPHQASYSVATGTVSSKVRQPGREADHLPPSSAGVQYE